MKENIYLGKKLVNLVPMYLLVVTAEKNTAVDQVLLDLLAAETKRRPSGRLRPLSATHTHTHNSCFWGRGKQKQGDDEAGVWIVVNFFNEAAKLIQLTTDKWLVKV